MSLTDRARKSSAGLLAFRRREQGLQVYLVHPGGPFFARKDAGWWGIPKGRIEENEEALEAAQREFTEETGAIAGGPFHELGDVRLKSGKRIQAWAFEVPPDREIDLHSNNYFMEWPPRSGTMREFPEVDRGAFFSLPAAHEKISTGQAPLLARLLELPVLNAVNLGRRD